MRAELIQAELNFRQIPKGPFLKLPPPVTTMLPASYHFLIISLLSLIKVEAMDPVFCWAS